jgi:hypothetical protein
MKSSVSIATRTPRTATAFASLGLTMGLIFTLAGCSADGTTYGNTHGAPSTGVYVIQNTPAFGTTTAATGTILQFDTAASGAATPVSTIANLNVTSLGFLAVDATGDIYTSATEGTTGTSILEFPVTSSNNAQPTRAIPFNTTTGLTAMSGLAVDATGDIYASNTTGEVSVFSSSATGSIAPTSSVIITSDAGPQATAVDPSGNVYIATAPPLNNIAIAPIEVFAPGIAAPTRSLFATSPAATRFSAASAASPSTTKASSTSSPSPPAAALQPPPSSSSPPLVTATSHPSRASLRPPGPTPIPPSPLRSTSHYASLEN